MSKNKLTLGNLDGASSGIGGTSGTRIESGTGRFYGRRIEEAPVEQIPVGTEGPPGPPGPPGPSGTNGRNAYQLALDNGFVGTEQEWLLSLVGQDGLSAYEIAVDTGFDGDISAWLLSLTGPPGPAGAQGISMSGVIPIAVTSTSLLASQANFYLYFTANTPKSVTIDPDSIEAMPENGEFYIRNSGLGDLTIIPGDGVIIDPPAGGLLVVPSGGNITLKRITSDVWDLFGQVYSDGSENELPPITGNQLKHLAVNADATGVEWVEAADPNEPILFAVITEPSATADLLSADSGSYKRWTSTAPKVLTVQLESIIPQPENGEWYIRNASTSDLTIVANPGVVINVPHLGTLVVPPDGLVVLKRISENVYDLSGQVRLDPLTAFVGLPYVIPFGFSFTPRASEILLIHSFSTSVTFMDNFGAAAGYVGELPTAAYTLTVSRVSGGSTLTVGTITISTAGAVTFDSTGTDPVVFSTGDALIISAPAIVDTTIANVAVSLSGVRS